MSGVGGIGGTPDLPPLREPDRKGDGEQGGQYFGGGRRRKPDQQAKPDQPAPDETPAEDPPADTDLPAMLRPEPPPAERPTYTPGPPPPLSEAEPGTGAREALLAAVQAANEELGRAGRALRVVLLPRPKGGLLLALRQPHEPDVPLLGDRDALRLELPALEARLKALAQGGAGGLFSAQA